MTTLLVIIWAMLTATLLFVVSIKPRRTRHSHFELEHHGSVSVIRRERLLGDVIAIRRAAVILLVVVLSGLGVVTWQGWGILVTIFLVFIVLHIAHVPFISKRINRYYKQHEPSLLDLVEKVPLIGKLFYAEHSQPSDLRIESTQQLLHLVESAGHILSEQQQAIIFRGLDWHSIVISSVMTPRDDIVSVKHSELLGPLVLHDLHESGHTIFPVIESDLDTILGTLNIMELLQVDKMKNSKTAEKTMTSEVITVSEDVLLPDALKLLVSSHRSLLVVIDDDAKTIGLATASDILDALLGKNRGEVVN